MESSLERDVFKSKKEKNRKGSTEETADTRGIFSKEKDIYDEEGFKAVDALEEKAWTTGQDYSKEIDIAFSRALKNSHSLGAAELHRLERKRLEASYVDGPKDYEQIMKFSVTLGLARHSAGGQLNPLEFFEKALKSGV